MQIKRPKDNQYPIKLIGIDEDTETIVERIIQQNHLPCKPEDIEVKKTWKGRLGTTAVFALNRKGHRAVHNKTHVNIGWNRCRIFDHFFLPRCNRCADHGHSSVNCDEPTRCVNCGRRSHTKENCRNDPYCNACEKRTKYIKVGIIP